MNVKPHYFGVRHFSPSGAHHLLEFLNRIKPRAVLVEGLSDATDQIRHFASKKTQPPIAILAYTEELPVRTLIYPFAQYSPEYQALLWASQHGAQAAFIDLPSDIFIALEHLESGDGSQPPSNRGSVYDQWAARAGESDQDTYWEYNFEHNLNRDAYRTAAAEFGRSIRELIRDHPSEFARNLIREAWMKRQILKTVENGIPADQIVVVTGAYHSEALEDTAPLSDEELSLLPRMKTRLTLMPYSYYRLSSRSGYGAGNNAPAYYERMWNCLSTGDVGRLPGEYLSQVAFHLRESGTHRSTAEVIDSVRLANTLAALHQGSAPALRDLRDAAVVCLGGGELSVVAEAVAMTEIGTEVGRLPEGVSRTSIQDDFYRELKRLRLEKYRTEVAMDLDLDLRENRRVQSEDSAFMDLNRSFFLHRLKALNISFQQYKPVAQQSATWAESWILRWSPQAEIEMVESALRGETLELATAYAFQERLETHQNLDTAAQVIREAFECGIPESAEQARLALQKLSVDAVSFVELARALGNLSTVIQYGDVRRIDSNPLLPMLQQLFLRTVLLMRGSCRCDNQAAKDVVEAIHRMNAIALTHFEQVDEAAWITELTGLSELDNLNPLLSGYACAILLERNRITPPELEKEVSRRLSPGIDADLGAGWFEGLSMRNRYGLLARMELWQRLDEYITTLDGEQFKRALVFLRRAFGDFGPQEKRSICENLGEIWNIHREDASDLLNRPLSDAEQKTLSDLNAFDFGDL